MANEKRLIPRGDKVTLDELPCGTLFAFGDDCIAIKSEYRCNNGLIEAFIIDSGEQFWGGAKTAKEQNELKVQPLEVVEVDAVKVVHGRWLSVYEYALKLGVTDKERLEEAKKDKWWKFCNDCEQQVKGFHNYCPNCGAKMDGDGDA